MEILRIASNEVYYLNSSKKGVSSYNKVIIDHNNGALFVNSIGILVISQNAKSRFAQWFNADNE